MGQIVSGVAKEGRTYFLRVQSGCDGLDREWCSKGRVNVLAEGAERVRWVIPRISWMRKSEHTF